MRQFLNKFTRSPTIPHFRLQLPLLPRYHQRLLADLSYKISNKSPAFFVSFHGVEEKFQLCNNLRNAIKLASDRHRVPVYSFLEDNINGLTYYLATASKQVYANPFCLLGDITTPTKSYTNIHKLLKFLGISIDKIGSGKQVWSYTQATPEHEKQFTQKWLKLVQQRLKTDIGRDRSVNAQVLQQFGNKLINPKKAEQLKLIDKVITLQQYKAQHFPNNKLVQYRYGTTRNIDNGLTRKQMNVLLKMRQILETPQNVLMSMEDPLTEISKNFMQILESRLSDPLKLEQLDSFLGKIMEKVQQEVSQKMKLPL